MFWASLAFGQIYQWVDENGVRHFSDQPPPDGRESERARTGRLSTYSPAVVPRSASPRQSTQPVQPSQPELASNERLCQYYLSRLEYVRVQLRSGYREPRGNQLRAERRELSTRYRSECT